MAFTLKLLMPAVHRRRRSHKLPDVAPFCRAKRERHKTTGDGESARRTKTKRPNMAAAKMTEADSSGRRSVWHACLRPTTCSFRTRRCRGSRSQPDWLIDWPTRRARACLMGGQRERAKRSPFSPCTLRPSRLLRGVTSFLFKAGTRDPLGTRTLCVCLSVCLTGFLSRGEARSCLAPESSFVFFFSGVVPGPFWMPASLPPSQMRATTRRHSWFRFALCLSPFVRIIRSALFSQQRRRTFRLSDCLCRCYA